jgi:predicted MFS family arabinose efflux permease
MDGLGGHPGWAWIFILEGLFTVVFGLCSFFLLPRGPEHCRFLNETEKAYVLKELRDTGATGQTAGADEFSWIEVGRAFMLPQVQLLAVIFFFDGALVYALAYFTPSIVQALGYTAARAQLFSVPPFAVAFIVTMVSAYVSDRFRCRGLVSIFCGLLCTIGFAMYLGSNSFNIKYGSLFLSIAGAYCAAPALSTWGANNAAPHTRKATAIAIGFIMTNSGGILVTWLFGALSPPPLYTKACITMLIFSVLLIVFSVFNILYLSYQNKKKAAIRETTTKDQEKPGLGDKSAWFIYSL